MERSNIFCVLFGDSIEAILQSERPVTMETWKNRLKAVQGRYNDLSMTKRPDRPDDEFRAYDLGEVDLMIFMFPDVHRISVVVGEILSMSVWRIHA